MNQNHRDTFKSICKKSLLPSLVVALALSSCSPGKQELYQQMEKIDAHVHIRTEDPAIMEFAKAEGFRFLTINTRSNSQEYIDQQKRYATEMVSRFPHQISYLTTFSMENFKDPGWAEGVIEKLATDFEDGAIGVKVWKDIGMTFRYASGDFVLLDDPLFAPILEFISRNQKPLLAHIGEPKNCWLPIDSMTVNSDKGYFSRNPQYHMYLHPEYPSYERLIESRDNVLARHPGLQLIGAHLGSLEWDVDELAKRLDNYPNFCVDMAARVCHFQVQERDKVKEFIEKYQDRLLYSTDFGIGEDDFEQRSKWLKKEWESDWLYFTTDDLMSSDKVDFDFRGLDLDKGVLRKIYASNALKWYPGIFE